ncbi:MAG: polyphosphate polymerase domain-containing protein [Eubacteriales bacterium]
MIRNEIKYIISPIKKDILIKKLECLCQRDPNCISPSGYRVSSLYFDDYNNSSYYDKVNGINYRKKYRIRAYNNETKKINLEKKVKHENICEKQVFPITYDEYISILRGNLNFLKLYTSPTARDFYFSYTSKGLRPKSLVSYDRDGYIYKYGNVRITFDSNIKSSINGIDIFDNNKEIEMPYNKNIIMEVKYTEYLPSNIKAIIQNSSVMPLAISKYINTRIV